MGVPESRHLSARRIARFAKPVRAGCSAGSADPEEPHSQRRYRIQLGDDLDTLELSVVTPENSKLKLKRPSRAPPTGAANRASPSPIDRQCSMLVVQPQCAVRLLEFFLNRASDRTLRLGRHKSDPFLTAELPLSESFPTALVTLVSNSFWTTTVRLYIFNSRHRAHQTSPPPDHRGSPAKAADPSSQVYSMCALPLASQATSHRPRHYPSS